MTSRTDLPAILVHNRRRMDAERRELARRAVEIVERNGRGEAFDMTAYALTMRELDRVFDEFYGAFPGDTRARFWALILEDARSARALAFQGAVQDVRRRLRREPVLLRAIREAV